MTPFAVPDVSAFDDWRREARRLIAAEVPPEAVVWSGGQSLLPAAGPIPVETGSGGFTVPARFIDAAEAAACFRDDSRWALLYRILWRLTHGEPHLLDIVVDDDVHRLTGMAKAVRRDEHKMHAFVRFRKVPCGAGVSPAAVSGSRLEACTTTDHYIAWHRPDHLIVRRTAPW